MYTEQHSTERKMGKMGQDKKKKRKKKLLSRIQWKWIHSLAELMGYYESDVKKQVHSTECLYKKNWIGEISY